MNTNKNGLKDKIILITGGTGTFGNNFIHHVLSNYKIYKPRKIIIYSRDEYKQVIMKNNMYQKYKNIIDTHYKKYKINLLRYFIGNIRDKERLNMAFNKVDFVIHAAALKHVPVCEFNPQEAIKTNIDGTTNVINACLNNNIQKAVLLSTDKAVEPINLYGASKMVAEKNWTFSNNYAQTKNSKFIVARYGNIVGSRGSIVDLFTQQDEKQDKFMITDPEMTRFWLDIKDAVKLTIFGLSQGKGGEIIIPLLRGSKIIDIPRIINPQKKITIIGARPGEKIHEQLINRSEINRIHKYNNYYIITPENSENFQETIDYYSQYKIHPDNLMTSDVVERISQEKLIKLIGEKHD